MNTSEGKLPQPAPPGIRRSPLRVLGIGDIEESVYRALLEVPGLRRADLVRAVSLSERQVQRALAELQSMGLVSRSPTSPIRYVPTPPQPAIEVLAARRAAEVAEARLMAAEFEQTFRERADGGGAEELVEVVTGTEALDQRYVAMEIAAQREVLALVKPPYVLNMEDFEIEVQSLRRGVAVRFIYDHQTLEIPGQMDVIYALIAAGAEQRTLAAVPMKLFVTDRQQALIPIQPEQPQRGALIVHGSPLVDALGMLFDALWRRASPIGVLDDDRMSETGLSDEEVSVLTLLAVGMKDQAIARRLGTSYRNVQRVVARILAILDAESRFQAGIRARDQWELGGSDPMSKSDSGPASASRRHPR